MRSAPANQIGTGSLPPAAEAWLAEQGAVFARMDADGVLEFSCRPLQAALTDAVRDLLPARRHLGLAPASKRTPVSAPATEPAIELTLE